MVRVVIFQTMFNTERHMDILNHYREYKEVSSAYTTYQFPLNDDRERGEKPIYREKDLSLFDDDASVSTHSLIYFLFFTC